MYRPPLPDDLERIHSIVGASWNRLRERRLLVTGGTGFVGKWMLASLMEANRRLGLNCRAVVLTRDSAAFRASVPWLVDAAHIELISGDVRDFAGAPGAFDHVIHAATDVARNAGPLETFDTCVRGTRNILDFAVDAGVRSMLLVSSGAIYGRQETTQAALSEDCVGGFDPLSPTAAYAEGKRAAEFLAAAYDVEGGMRVKIARCFAFVGPFLPLDGPFAIGNFMHDAISDRPVLVQGDGTTVRSYMHATDMAAWLWLVMLEGRPRIAYNVGSDAAVSLRELAMIVAQAAGSSKGIDVLGAARQGLASNRYVADTLRARTELRVPPPLGLAESVSLTLQWLKAGQACASTSSQPRFP